MIPTFLYPLTSRAREIFYKSPPAPEDISFLNVEQSFTATCLVDTGTFTATVPAGTFVSRISVEDANAQALAHAQALAEAGLICGVIACSARMGTGVIDPMLDPPDTEEAAMLRIFPDSDSGWSGFESPESSGCCTARIAARGEGENAFEFTQVRFQIVSTSHPVGSAGTIAVDIMRRVDRSLVNWTHFATLQLDAVADSGGTFTFVGEVPNVPGYETYVRWANSSVGNCSGGGSGGC